MTSYTVELHSFFLLSIADSAQEGLLFVFTSFLDLEVECSICVSIQLGRVASLRLVDHRIEGSVSSSFSGMADNHGMRYLQDGVFGLSNFGLLRLNVQLI